MHNPNSAIERVKNHLAYKLGQAMIDFTNNGGGYIALFKKLYKIKKQHKKEQKIYQQTIQIFPQLKYPSLETCSDYEQALRYKFHLSYMLGEVLIKADKTWYKGSGFKLKNDIKKAKKEFQIFKEILTEIKELNGKALKAIKDNQQFFLKEFPRIKNILKIHKNYQPILDNIFHNFNYFIQNFDLIEEWLLSDDFNERYKKGNHPYPSLLDPKKLNDENEKINYKNIPAELAWDMNLPLPDKYKFVYLGFGLSGHAALNLFLKKSLNVVSYLNSIEYIYSFFKSDACFFIFIHNMNDIEKVKKFLYRIYSQPVLFLTRDPIERLKHGVNHGWYAHPHQNIFDTYIIKECKIDVILDRVKYTNIKDYKVLFNNLQFWINSASFNYATIRNCIDTQIFYLDMKDIMPNKAFNTIKKLSKILNFNPPKEENKDFYKEIKTSHFRYILPIILIYNDIKFYVTLKNEKENNYVDVEKYFNFRNEIKKYICFSVNPLDEVKLLNFINDKYLNDFFNNFLSILNKKFIHIKKSKITTNGILWCLKKNSELKKILKKILDEELIHIKQHRPDIVASWKYYQEFEKMCKELDR